jgi:hypothetical protein
VLTVEPLEARNLAGSLADLAGLNPPLPQGNLAALLADLGDSSDRFAEALALRVAPEATHFSGVFPPDTLLGASLPGVRSESFDTATATWYVQGRAFAYGGPGWLPVTGDWDGDGTVTIGVVDPLTNTWYLKNSIQAGAPDVAPFRFGAPGWRPVVGQWDHAGMDRVGVIDPEGVWHLAVPGGVLTALHG